MIESPLELDVGGEEVPFTPDVDLLALLEAVAAEEVEYAILGDTTSEWFVQAAGIYGSLTVEFQWTTADGRRQQFRLSRSGLGDAGEQRRPPRVPGYQGYLEKEVLSVEDGLEAFQLFIARREMPARFQVEDITAELGLG